MVGTWKNKKERSMHTVKATNKEKERACEQRKKKEGRKDVRVGKKGNRPGNDGRSYCRIENRRFLSFVARVGERIIDILGYLVISSLKQW